MVLINKIDLYSPDQRDIDKIKNALDKIGLRSLAISALTGEGIDNLKKILKEQFFTTCDGIY
jgi:putative ribosome biogenesis GTPase RsgA